MAFQLQTRERTIDGLSFKVTQLPAWAGYRLFIKLSKMLGPSLLRSLSGVSLTDLKGALSKALETDLDLSKVADGLESLLAQLTPEEFERLSKELLESSTVTVDGKEQPLLPVFDLVMAGRLLAMGSLLKFALEVNFKSF